MGQFIQSKARYFISVIAFFLVFMSSCEKEEKVSVHPSASADTSVVKTPVTIQQVDVKPAGQQNDTAKKSIRVMTFVSFGN